jgi:O-acetyl-ADP-ribose deacetylase (regulator of RNase III)
MIQVCQGDLLDQKVEVIVNAWNRNFFPWWLLLPQGVSGAIKRRAGLDPFRELAKMKMIPLGGAVETTPGKLTFKAIIHVAGISMFWRSSERAIRGSVTNALNIAERKGYRSIAFPLIGAGTGGLSASRVLAIMRDEAQKHTYDGEVRIVQFRRQ